MIGSCNCPITTLQIVIVMIGLLMVHVTLQIMTCLISE